MTHDAPTLLDRLSSVAAVFCAARGLSTARVSTLVFNEGGKLGEIIAGRVDLTTRRYERAMAWFSDNWPEGAVWPEGVARPGVVAEAAE
jgi:hypothetical protein